MAALLERDALISEIDKEIDFYDDSKHQDDKFITLGIKIARKLVKKYPAVNRWIPCSERMPENDAKCLVYTSDKRICMARWYGKYDEQGAWYIISDDVPKLYRIKNVPFWMPLPEPPKEDEEDADN